MKVLFGPAGFGMPILDGLQKVNNLGLGAAEVEFTYGVRMSNVLAEKAGRLAKRLGIVLSVHAPYYINLASEERTKLKASKTRILESCERAHRLGAHYVVFHAAYYGKLGKEGCYEKVKMVLEELYDEIKARKLKVKLAPETTGKQTQFGELDELLSLSKETGCGLCVDFAHMFARHCGRIDYDDIFKKIKKIGHIHAHFSGITYGPKGEKEHIRLKKDFFVPLGKAIKRHKPRMIVIINESPAIYKDAVLMQRWFKEL